MRRFRLAVTSVSIVAVVAAALLVAGPASAATALTRTQVKHALLTASQLGDGWQVTTGSGSGGTSEVQGCEEYDFETVGVRVEAERSFRFGSTATLVQETVQSFRTTDGARTDFRKGVRQLSSCSSFSINGQDWTIARLSMPTVADRRAMFQLSGAVETASGTVPLTVFVAVTVWGHHEIATSAAIGGVTTAAVRRESAEGARRIALAATTKVAKRLGR
jgi:hypothetical protein